jgi:transcription elongation factor Elf1
MTCAKKKIMDASMVCGICGLPLPFYAVHSVLYFEYEYDAFICGVCAVEVHMGRR